MKGKSFKPFIMLFYVSMMLGFALLFFPTSLSAQELNADVSVFTKREVRSFVYPETIQSMQKDIQTFFNETAWTESLLDAHEKIEIKVIVTIKGFNAETNRYTASVQIQSVRPVFNSTYVSREFMINDDNFDFHYVEGLPLSNNFTFYREENELSFLLSYYANMLLGIDFDSFSPLGGTPYFTKAKRIVEICQNSDSAGWEVDTKTEDNRYWLAENFTNRSLAYLRTFIYKYHREGLDQMYANPDAAKRNILISLQGLQKLERIRKYIYARHLIMLAKVEELVGIFSETNPRQKQDAFDVLSEIDPLHAGKYKKILKK